MAFRELRRDYGDGGLSRADLDPDPFRQFHEWFKTALENVALEPNAMTLATSTPDGRPSARIVLLKDVREQHFLFFSDYSSRKGRELQANPHAALVLVWHELARQVRIEGIVSRLDREESREYFHSRPRGSQAAASASLQSSELADRATLEKRFAELQETHREEIPLPDRWGGYALNPTRIEFWQGRASRLHDRFVYQRSGQDWQIVRLSP